MEKIRDIMLHQLRCLLEDWEKYKKISTDPKNEFQTDVENLNLNISRLRELIKQVESNKKPD